MDDLEELVQRLTAADQRRRSVPRDSAEYVAALEEVERLSRDIWRTPAHEPRRRRRERASVEVANH